MTGKILANPAPPSVTDDRSRMKGSLRELRGKLNRRILKGFFYMKPLRYRDSGLSALLSASTAKRYDTLLGIGNRLGSREFRASHGELQKLDGVAPRTARDCDRTLTEYGIVRITGLGRGGQIPFTYLLCHPDEWTPPPMPTPRITYHGKLKVEFDDARGAPAVFSRARLLPPRPFDRDSSPVDGLAKTNERKDRENTGRKKGNSV